MAILVTGATGYIGSHVSLELLRANYPVVLLDNLINSKKLVITRLEELSNKKLPFYNIDLLNLKSLEAVFSENDIEGVIHLAGHKSVTESIKDPIKYYVNNVFSLLNLLIVMEKYNSKNFVFSSSATVYGNHNKSPLSEDMDLLPINPYGKTKLVCEGILEDLYNADNRWSIISLRYFNPVSADKSGLIGEDPTNVPNNIMPLITGVAIGKIPSIDVFGNDYDTPDGTCIRDFIHITDLAKGHIKALEKNKKESGFNIYNLGTGKGYSVLELINTFIKVTNINIPYKFADRRPGDIDISYANPNKALEELGWKADLSLEDMCLDAWRWEKNNNKNYGWQL